MGRYSDPKNQTPKAPLHQKKTMLSIWRDWKKILYPVEILIRISTVNNWTNWRKSWKKTPRIDQPEGRRLPSRQRTTSHFFEDPEKKLRELDWEVLPYPPYSPDLAPSNYHLFRILEHYLRGENFESAKHIKTSLLQFFEQKG